MKSGKPAVLAFLLRFTLIFGLLIVPWPGWNGLYGNYFRSLAGAIYHDDERQIVLFDANPNGVKSGLDTRITLGNRALLDSEGKGPVRRTELDSRSIGWVPTALTLALVAATPIPWRRRWLSLLCGFVLIHVFIWLSLQSWVWAHAQEVSLLTLSSFWAKIAAELDYTLLNQMGVSFTVPVLIWILVTFRQQDLLSSGNPAPLDKSAA